MKTFVNVALGFVAYTCLHAGAKTLDYQVLRENDERINPKQLALSVLLGLVGSYGILTIMKN